MIDGRESWARAAEERHRQRVAAMDLDSVRAENIKLRMVIEALVGVRLGTSQEKARQLNAARVAARKAIE